MHSFSAVARAIEADVAAVLDLDRRKSVVQGLSRREFVEERAGIPASHCSVVLAQALLKAGSRIDVCLGAVAANSAIDDSFLPDFHKTSTGPSGRALVRTANHLRSHVRMDRHYEQRSTGWEDTNKGSQMVRKAVKRFESKHPVQAVEALVPDPALCLA